MKRWTYNRVYQAMTSQPLLVPRLTPDEVVILQQAEQIRRDFGEAGVERYFEMLATLDAAPGAEPAR